MTVVLKLPTGYLTVTQPRHRPAQMEVHEVEAGRVSLVDRLWEYGLGKKSDVPQLLVIFGVILPAVLVLIFRNIIR